MNTVDTAHRRAAGRTLVLGDPFVLQPCRLADRLLARALGASLDEQLAAGRSPESARLLAARAEHIVALAPRTSLARNWGHVLRVAEGAAAGRGPTLPLNISAILSAEPAIRELMRRLSAPLPVTAHGVAAATVLLTNAASPVYGRHSRDTLADLLDDAINQLDPGTPLMNAD
jgi:hypothetical protein